MSSRRHRAEGAGPFKRDDGCPAGISIAMATLNGSKYLPEQLHSISAQTSPPRELVVCDDGSTDATVEILNEFAAASSFPVRVIRNPTRLGARDNFLRAARLCASELIAFSDQDDVWEPGKLTACEQAFRDPEVALVVHAVSLIDRRGRRIRGGNAVHADIIRTVAPRAVWDAPAGAHAMVFRSHLLLHVPLDPGLTAAIEGQDGWIWVLACGLGKIAYMKETLTRYRRHGGNTTNNPYRWMWWQRGLRSLRTSRRELEGASQYHAARADAIDTVARRSDPKLCAHLEACVEMHRLQGIFYARRASLCDSRLPRALRLKAWSELRAGGAYSLAVAAGGGRFTVLRDLTRAACGL